MRLFYSGVSNSVDPRNAVPSVDLMTSFELRTKGSKPPPTKTVGRHFLDSGAYSLRRTSLEHATTGDRWLYFRSASHRSYLDAYAEYVKVHGEAIDYYTNVDVMGNPKLTWRNQKYLEREHGLEPVPVVHFGTPLEWLERYVAAGYRLIGLGGLIAGKWMVRNPRNWLYKAITICSDQSGVPKLKLHGFGVTNFDLMRGVPWWSVDSTTWIKLAAYGKIWIPRKRRGVFDFESPPFLLFTPWDSPYKSKDRAGQHLLSLPKSGFLYAEVAEWLDSIGIPIGAVDGAGNEVEPGVLTQSHLRWWANVRYFERLRASLPTWPWAFERKTAERFKRL